MYDDGTMRLIDVTTEEDSAPGGAGRRGWSAEAQLRISISGVSGDTVTLSVPRSEVENPEELDAGALLQLAIERGHDDFDGTPDELARRRSFLQGLPDQIAQATGSPGARYLLMADDPDVGARPAHPRAPVRLHETPEHDLQVHFTVAPYHVGGDGA